MNNGDLIRRSDLIVTIMDTDGWTLANDEDLAIELASNATAVDAVEVVRCKDCIYCLKDNSGREVHLCMKKRFPQQVKLDGFCSDGKTKEGADNG